MSSENYTPGWHHISMRGLIGDRLQSLADAKGIRAGEMIGVLIEEHDAIRRALGPHHNPEMSLAENVAAVVKAMEALANSEGR